MAEDRQTEAINEALSAHAERAEILYEVREQRKKIDQLEQVVSRGNGHKPLTERVTTLEAEVETIKAGFDEMKGDIRALRKNQNVMVWKLIGGLGAILALFLAGFIAFVYRTNAF
jgi:chromosome segregation ATPase